VCLKKGVRAGDKVYCKEKGDGKMGIKAVFLDVDNTILDFNICAKESMKATFLDFGLHFEEEMFPPFLEVNGHLWEEIEQNRITREELYKIRWKMIFEKLQIEGPDPVEFDTVFRKYIGEIAVPIDGAYELLAYLSEKYILCIASNASHARQVKRLTKANMMQYVKHLFTSEKIGYPKPEKAFFDACLTELGNVAPEECVVIGDSLTADIAGGIVSGMKTIWYNHNHEGIPTKVKPDYIVNALGEIINIL